jgi:hypothetical protein
MRFSVAGSCANHREAFATFSSQRGADQKQDSRRAGTVLSMASQRLGGDYLEQIPVMSV